MTTYWKVTLQQRGKRHALETKGACESEREWSSRVITLKEVTSSSLLVLDAHHPVASRNQYLLCIIDRVQRLENDPRAQEDTSYMPRVELKSPLSLKPVLVRLCVNNQ